MLYFVVDLKTERVICQFDNVADLEYFGAFGIDERHRAKYGVFVGRWVSEWSGPYMFPDMEYLKRSLGAQLDGARKGGTEK